MMEEITAIKNELRSIASLVKDLLQRQSLLHGRLKSMDPRGAGDAHRAPAAAAAAAAAPGGSAPRAATRKPGSACTDSPVLPLDSQAKAPDEGTVLL